MDQAFAGPTERPASDTACLLLPGARFVTTLLMNNSLLATSGKWANEALQLQPSTPESFKAGKRLGKRDSLSHTFM